MPDPNSPTPENPPAFPTSWPESFGRDAYAAPGMTLRDYFAAKCAAAIVGTIRDDHDYERIREMGEHFGLTVSEWIAREAGKQADAMLAERAK